MSVIHLSFILARVYGIRMLVKYFVENVEYNICCTIPVTLAMHVARRCTLLGLVILPHSQVSLSMAHCRTKLFPVLVMSNAIASPTAVNRSIAYSNLLNSKVKGIMLLMRGKHLM